MRIPGAGALAGLLAGLALAGCITKRDLYPNGQVRREGKMLGSDQIGEWTYWYDTGRLKAKGLYEKDVQVGAWTYWHDNGNKEMEGLYAAAVRDGKPEGSTREGRWHHFHRNGNPRAVGFFVRGRESGPWTFWNPDGQIAQQGDYSDGKPALRWTTYRGNGAKQSEGFWLDGRKVGTWEFWGDDGKPFQKSYALPAGVALVRENWEDGKLRREGFQRDGKAIGRWSSFHQNGKRRTSGDFQDGVADGGWMAWDPEGELLAVGTVRRGRPVGEWKVWTRGLESPWHADEITPPAVATTGWSPDEITRSESPEQVVMTWIAEASSDVEEPVAPAAPAVVASAPAAEAPPVALEQAAEKKAEVPVKDQPYTTREENEFDKYVQNYGLDPKATTSTGSRYGRPRSPSATLAGKGDEEKAEPMLGKPLPVAEFRCADGRTIKLEDYKGRRVLMVVLRGYGSGVCVYCNAQTEALSSPDVKKAIESLGCDVLLVYPGPENGWDAFLAKYMRAGKDVPPYPCLFDPELKLVRQLSIEGNQAIPSSLILDDAGVVRFAYVGTTIDDRPSAKRLVAEIKKLCPNP
jgi:antitoxin component YwqK of YwqJK toxin-antitoxin module/peroxiredoxin